MYIHNCSDLFHIMISYMVLFHANFSTIIPPKPNGRLKKSLFV